MKIAITGADGYVGRRLLTYPNVVRLDGDVTDHEAIRREIEFQRPDVVVHLAEKSGVDWCETHQRECDEANLWGTANVADACEKANARCVILSSFHVFKGDKMFHKSYSENEEPHPVNFYGLSKLASEAVSGAFPDIKVVRTGYLFDAERMRDRIDLLNRTDDNHYTTFQYRSFMHLHHFCDSFMGKYVYNFDIMPHILHISGSETVSWYEFMSHVARELGTKCFPIKQTRENEAFVARPHKAGLNTRLSYQLGFDKYSFKDGIKLLKEGI